MKVSKAKKNQRKKLWGQTPMGAPSPCPNCGEPGPHFVPPSLGEKGFFMCEAKQPVYQVGDMVTQGGGLYYGPRFAKGHGLPHPFLIADEPKEEAEIPDDHISAMRIDVFEFDELLREKLRAHFPVGYVRRAWIPQTMGDQNWSFFGFLCTGDRVAWEQSLPEELGRMLDRNLVPRIRHYGWGVRDMNGFLTS